MEQKEKLYSGKAKTVFQTDDPELYIMEFHDATSAFDGLKIEHLTDKGKVNNRFNAFIMEKLEAAGIKTHFVKLLSDTTCVVRKLQMLPIECVVRNIAAGNLCKRFAIEEGRELNPPTFELFLKSDELHDPMINQYHAVSFGWATEEQLDKMRELTLTVNQVLKQLFFEADMLLVDYKLEFGVSNGEVLLGDEFSPDGCRIWDRETRKKMDKDRFRQNLGDVIETYKEVAQRLGVELD